ncbi:carbohydrate ABC transporter permease [Paenibacillus xerothermodurans]|uniref:Carbohydrate ABC transporter permease n=1 Tax=Paenibacillus xerothermodurans TaxID=1977292 RepID=A0A2W1P3C2_PAEXE|nr:carbohydrate ABC transporter permease [Paenibacillus xerothermodurans]PZE21668.1 carbohydrate ABC transporter permease [Paenibacillus xerothermodurans]
MSVKQVKRWALFFLMLIVVLLVNLPILTMIINSLKSNSEILSSKHIFPNRITFENYGFLNTRTKFWEQFKNSWIVSFYGTGFSILIAAFAGYAVSRYRSWLISGFSRSLLMLQMFPIILVLIPLFIMFRKMGLIDSHFAVILLYITVHLPFAIWMYKGFFDAIPKDLEEAAWIDGCTRLQSFTKVVLPISGPGVAAVAIFSFLFSWNDYLIASVFLRNEGLMTIPVGLQLFMQQYATDWGSLTAAATLAMLPVFIFLLFVQKYMIHGAVAGSVKG